LRRQLEIAAMLFRPPVETNLAAIEAMLDGWNDDADRFRKAAMAVRRGEEADGLVARAAFETRDAVARVLDEIEASLDRLPPGDRRLTELLQILVTAQALAESIERSWEVLAIAPEVPGPAHIAHEYAIAAQ
jgi:hypothetical protein